MMRLHDGHTSVAREARRLLASCPVAPPRPENMRFHPTAASAQQAGFRACKRCRPDATPGSPEWSVRADATARAMRLVADGVVDREGVAGLAARLGYSERHVERMLRAEVGAGPLALARAQRAQTARVLVETTDVPMADVAFAAGFASIRSFNATVAEVFACTPTELRQRAGGHRARSTSRARADGDRGVVPAQHAAEPDAGVLAERDVARHDRVRGDERAADRTHEVRAGEAGHGIRRHVSQRSPAPSRRGKRSCATA